MRLNSYIKANSTSGMQTAKVIKGFCVKCRKKVDIKEPTQVKLKNGKPATKGTCPDCGTKVFRIGKIE